MRPTAAVSQQKPAEPHTKLFIFGLWSNTWTLPALLLIHLGGISVGVQPHESEKASVSARLQIFPGIQSLKGAS